MKRKTALLLAVIMILTCIPVMGAMPEGADAATAEKTVSVSSTGTWKKSGSNYRYYVNGTYVKNTVLKISGNYYAFGSGGYLRRGWVTLNGSKYYASRSAGAKGYGSLLLGHQKIGSYNFYFDPSAKGAMVKSKIVKVTSGNVTKYYYFGSNGVQTTTKGKKIKYGSSTYVVQADGSVQKEGDTAAGSDNYGMDKKAQGYSSSTRYLILVNKSHHSVNVYQGSKGKWVCVRRNMACTIGKASTPSPSGKYTLNHKSSKAYGYKDFNGSTVFYATRISAGNYFHSILYKKGSRNPYTAKIKDASLGKNKSNSCIRLTLENAKYIWQVTPTNSRVIVY